MDHMPMMESLDSIMVNAFDLFALVTCIGIISFRLFVLLPHNLPGDSSQAAFVRFWQMLGIFLALLAVSSLALLIQRTMALSGSTLSESMKVLPTVLSQTHFGRIWLLRPAALLLLWFCWRQTRLEWGPGILTTMLVASAAIAATRSLSGHAADWGDVTIPEIVDCAHLLAVSVWAGSLIALLLSGFCILKEHADERRQNVTGIVIRWSTLAGISLAIVVVTGIYNTWREVGRADALWTTFYGKVLLVKLFLAVIIVLLGAANRYLEVPALRLWSAWFTRDEIPPARLAFLKRFVAFRWRILPRRDPLIRFIYRATLEGWLMIGVIICVAMLISLIPARHVNNDAPGHAHHVGGMMH